VSDTNQLLENYISFVEAARQPGMPSLRTLQRWAAERRLPGLLYLGRKPLINVEAFRAGLKAREVKVVSGRQGRRAR
jgi:hypothetical protein